MFLCVKKGFFVQNAGDICIDYDGLLNDPCESTSLIRSLTVRHVLPRKAAIVICSRGGLRKSSAHLEG